MDFYNAFILFGFLFAVLLNLREMPMLLLSFIGLLMLGVISPSLDPLDTPRTIGIAAALELLMALLFAGIAFGSRGRNGLMAGYSLMAFSFFNLSAHFGALYWLSRMGTLNDIYSMQLRVGECLQLLTVLVFALPMQRLGASWLGWLKHRSNSTRERQNGQRVLGTAWR